MSTTPILPTDFRSIIRLAKKYKIKLTRGACFSYEIERGEACVVSMLGVVNSTDYCGARRLSHEISKDKYWKLRLIEAGFEGWSNWMEAYNTDIIIQDGLAKSEIKQYYKIGERLYEHSVSYQEGK